MVLVVWGRVNVFDVSYSSVAVADIDVICVFDGFFRVVFVWLFCVW